MLPSNTSINISPDWPLHKNSFTTGPSLISNTFSFSTVIIPEILLGSILLSQAVTSIAVIV